MAFGSSSAKPVFVRRPGIGAAKVIAVNPTMTQINDAFGREIFTQEQEYVRDVEYDGKKFQSADVTFLLKFDPEVKDNNGYGDIHFLTFRIQNRVLTNSDETKIHVIDEFGRTAWVTKEEFEIMKTHTTHGAELLDMLEEIGDSQYSRYCRDIALYHHERWDGFGYPDRLAGENIPFSARVIAIADTYDAMTSTRSYRKALDHDIAIAEIEKCAGAQFDPVLAQKFIEIENIIRAAKDNPEEFYMQYSTLYKEIN